MNPFLLALFELFAAFALAWLRDRLKEAEAELGVLPSDPVLAVNDLFTAARDRLTLLDRLRGRVAVLNACRRVALARAPGLAARAAGDASVSLVLTGREHDAITGS